jgi:glycosyltransferase involved in cell wall biosynthesis
MKIGLVIYGSLKTLSGGYMYDRKLVEYLRAQGDTVEIISLPWRNYIAHLLDNLTFRLSDGFDIIIEDELNHPSLIAANHLPHPCPVISLVHHLRASEQRFGLLKILYRQVEKQYLQKVDGFIFNSHTTRQVVTELVGDTRPWLVAYPPTDRFGPAQPESLPLERIAGSPSMRVLFVGNLIHRKGLHTLVNALAIIKARHEHQQSPMVTLDVVGSPKHSRSYARIIREMALELGVERLITYHGSLKDDILARRFREAHVLVVPSSYEGFGMVYMEAMGFGMPALGTTAGGAAEIIQEGETGYLIKPDDAATLAERLITLASDRALLTRLSLNALKRYQEQPRWEQTAAEIRQFLQKMAK